MYLQNLPKKLVEFFSIKNLRHLLVNSFREIMIFISALGLLVIILIIFIISGSQKNFIKENQNVYQDKGLKKEEYITQETLLTPEEFLLPELMSFDISNDFVEFLPKKQFQSPDMSIIVKNYDKMIEDTIEDSCKFNFEKRKEIKRRKK